MNPHIVIIHDDWTIKTPTVQALIEEYGSDSVTFINESQKGIDFILENPSRKTIVLLDYGFKTGEPTGGEVFRRIREKSLLIYIIIITKNQNKDIDPDDFFEFVNNHALAIAKPSDVYTEILKLVDLAINQLQNRADVIIEEWINTKSEIERQKPYLALSDQRIYSLDELLVNIRKQTVIGKEITGSVLSLAIELVMKKLGQKDA